MEQHENPPVTALAEREPDSITLAGEPDARITDGQKAATALMRVLNSKKKVVQFNGETYLQFEDWQTIATLYGCSVQIEWARPIEIGPVIGFEARAVVVNGAGREVASAEAMCLSDESTWSNRPLFQLRSMAQTRASSKALKGIFSWVAVLAGCSPTPAEEMVGTTQGPHTTGPKPAARKRAPKKKAAPPTTLEELDGVAQTIVTVTGIAKADGDNQPWRISFSDGQQFSTFDEKLHEDAARLELDARTCTRVLELSKNGKYINVVQLRPVADPALADSPDDQFGPDDIPPPEDDGQGTIF